MIIATLHQVENSVFAVLRSLAPDYIHIDKSDEIIADIKLLSDDATEMIHDLEREYQINIPQSQWRTVWTVQDAIDLLCKYVLAEPE